jgi:hypothetical protein
VIESEVGEMVDQQVSRTRVVAPLGVMVMAVTVIAVLWLSLSSRGFSAIGDASEGARIVVRGVEGRLDTNIIDRSDVPWGADEVAHLLGWGALMIMVGLIFHRRWGLGDLAVGVFAASIGIEFLQKLVTTSRSMEAEDISANSLGVMLGLMVLVALERLVPSWHSSQRARPT